ncbi:MAG: cyclic nucleotide-binding domain-containing protein [Pyrinomonadaceae bacterium]
MPREFTNHEQIIDAIRRVEIVSDLVEQYPNGEFKHELDIDVVVFGRNYNGKQVGPYARLLEFLSGETILTEGTWESNIFYVLVEGRLDALVSDEKGEQKVGEILPGNSFGEMAILAGKKRSTTVRVAADTKALVLEFTRPALRLLRKFPAFGKILDRNYRKYGLNLVLNELKNFDSGIFNPDLLTKLGDAARFVVYEKNHVLFHEGDPINRLVFVRNGWIQRVSGADYNPGAAELLMNANKNIGVDFLGAGNCLGLESINGQIDWKYTATVLGRAEVLEVAVSRLRAQPELASVVLSSLSNISKVDDDVKPLPPINQKSLVSADRVIETGLVDTNNLLIMDMDLCVRCGNCSFACHQVHGHSRLVRRGVSIERPIKPVKPVSQKIQHALVPSVCLHCQDPECMTGCPTGAIARFANGEIDINPPTCIGCGDCATQCPYNAITMIPRHEKNAATKKPEKGVVKTGNGKTNFLQNSFAPLYNRFFSLGPTPLPAPVTQTDDLLAVKCNLCQGTGLNPPNSRRKAYSCEENCPTGALVRVNPREYFTEVQTSIGLIYQDQTHAIGRNIHKSDPLQVLGHIGGILLVLLGGGAALWGTWRYTQDSLLLENSWLTMRWLTGLAGLGGIVWTMAYPFRKQVYRRRAGALRYWLLSHIYLGVLAGFALLVHGGARSGGLLTSLLMISFDLVIASGIFGAFTYFIVPRLMTQIEGEPLLLEDLETRREELRAKLVEITELDDNPPLSNAVKNRVCRRFLSLSYLFRQYFAKEDLKTMLASAREEFKTIATTFTRADSGVLLEAVETAATLRRIDALCYLHKSLKLWLAPHVLFTALMLFLLVVHIIQVIYFNVR